MKTRTPRPIALSVVLALLSGLLVGLTFTVTPPASAAPVTDFDPGNIISDAAMYDARSMSASDIQRFLNVRGTNCVPTAGNTCIRSYRESTPSRAADALCRAPYAGTSNESAATIIAKVSVACGINPQVLLVTLQKEQGLITASAGKSAYTYSRALGFGCPDNVGGWCNPEYAGFANQVYSAAKQLKRYAANPTSYSYRAGRTNTILFHPNRACGSSSVYIQNQATASLYNYTPYRPNSAALAAGYGAGDSCSSYGNRNFHLYFKAWFGSPANKAAPFGVFDTATNRAGTSAVRLQGWAMDPNTSEPIRIHVYVNGKAKLSTLASSSRPDVEAAYRNGAAHGFDVEVEVGAGTHAVCIFAIAASGGNNPQIGCKSVTAQNLLPRGSFDAVAAEPGALRVLGWAFDPDTQDSIRVHVYVDGAPRASIAADKSRPDVGRAEGRGDHHGFDTSIPVPAGHHRACVYGIDATGGANSLLGCKGITTKNAPPRGLIDTASGAGGNVTISGWAFDPDAAGPVRVHMYVDGAPRMAVTADTHRPDVGRALKIGDHHGFSASVSATTGTHRVCAYAIDTSGGPSASIGCKNVVVSNKPPIGNVDSTTSTKAGIITMSGWAADPDTQNPISVRVALDGVPIRTLVASVPRPDVARSVGLGPDHGFALDIPSRNGQHTVCVTALDSSSGNPTSIGCRSVTVLDSPAVGALESATSTAATLSSSSAPSRSRIDVAGWAWDADLLDATTVEVLVNGDLAATVTADKAHAPLPGVPSSAVGFTTSIETIPGAYEVCVRAIDPQAPATPLGCRKVEVPNSAPIGILDSVTATAGGATVGGWAMDADSSGSLRVHVYATDAAGTRFGTPFTADQRRDDLDRVYQNGALHGFSGKLTLPPGPYTVCAYAVNYPSGPNPAISCNAILVTS
ncbi:hypothetical protein [Sanguibacter suaedae]|uniref:Hemagglutinin n=1 Tax=Sanguibacter suaedae TaxID=2795737 RepID=A0A934M6Y7_9MICO|nr:hypothetical protein [Sanguibacter suaedae]MBI9114777.1 hypothetical protein [Sanguibacter suaedae]